MSTYTRTAVKPLGVALREARDAAGLSLFEAAVAARNSGLVPGKLSAEKVRRVETGNLPASKVDPLLVKALCDSYGVALEDVAPDMAEWVDRLRSLIAADLPLARPTWNPENARQFLERRRIHGQAAA